MLASVQMRRLAEDDLHSSIVSLSMYRSSLMSASSVFDLDQRFLLVMSAFELVNRGAGVLKGGHDYAKRQQRRQPDGQLVGRNELDDGSGSDRTGPCVAIRLVTRTRREAMSPKQERPGLLPGFFNSPSSLSISA